MGKATHHNNGSTVRYLLNIPELDYCILDALMQSRMHRIGVLDMKDYYKDRGMKAPTSAAFSQALARLKNRGILNIERHECLWVEFTNAEIAHAIEGAFKACKEAQEKIGAVA